MNEINLEHINNLKQTELPQLLHKLISLEAIFYGLKDFDFKVPFNINDGDAGSDGRAQWTGDSVPTKYLKNKFTIFQSKASNLTQQKCYEEILIPKKKGETKRKLKAQIKKLVLANGCYILFTNKSIVDEGTDTRIEKFRKAIKDAGHANYSTFQIEIYDANEIKDWCNKYIEAVTLVQGFNGIHRPQGFIIWDDWEKLLKTTNNKFQVDLTVSNNIVLIKDSISKEKIIRVTGHSGLGKTRLVLEAFRISDVPNSVVYYDLGGTENISEIKNYIISYQDTQKGIIVIDNCNVDSHMRLSDLLKDAGNLKIITIGLDDSREIQYSKIKLERNNQRGLVKEIVQNLMHRTHSPTDIEYISTISEGYPGMAIKFCNAVLEKGMSELSKIPLDKFIQRLIFGSKPENDIEHDIIRACSVFSAFGFLDDSFRDVINKEFKASLKAQMDFIRMRIYDGSISETKFREICHKFLAEDIIERRGTYYIVKPTILAINLAANWLLNTDSDRIIQIIQELKQVGLDEKFVERLKDLDQIDKAKDIVAELWGPNSPFSSAEVLNTSWGSLLFRYVVEVNPSLTAKALEVSFGDMSKEEIVKIIEGRRNLVWALEKLCFRKETFNIASKILYLFAVSENETWGNNSTNQFIQLFQLLLSGTGASLMERIEVIKWGLNKKDDDYTQIAILAMGRGLMNDQFMRSGGAEKQGSSAPLEDYRPQWVEIIEYWEQLIELLTLLACSDNPHAVLAKEKIAHSIRTLIRDGQYKLIVSSIRKIVKYKGDLWSEALNNLRMTLEHEKYLQTEIIDEINSLIIELTPTDIKNQLLLKVSKPDWYSYEKDEDGHYIDKPKLNVEAFAQKLIAEKIPWTEHLQDLLTGEQRQGFNFGCKIGELTTDKESLINLSFEKLLRIKKENQNPEFIAGFLSGISDRVLFEKTIDRFILDNNISHHAFYLSRVINPTLKDIEKLFPLIDKYNFTIQQFYNFQYGRALDNLTNIEVFQLCDRICKYGNAGKWTALSLLFSYCYNNVEKWNFHKVFFKTLIGSTNLTINNEDSGRIDGFHWSETITKILTDEIDIEFANIIVKQIIEYCSRVNYEYTFEIYIGNVLLHLFDKYFERIWQCLSPALIGDYMTYFRLKNIIGNSNNHLGSREGMLFCNDNYNEIILNWCEQHPEIAPERIANMMPLSKPVNDEIKWHPFSKAIIDKFGDNENLLKQLSANMGTYGIVGSSIPYYDIQKLLLLELINHKIPKVKKWANEMLEYTIKTIKLENLNDEERLLN